ncbi:unnamed protein product [Cuscuta europaea]|uniref:BHLH domain-containing protein n=1 Tax=Cuscuta europaea TaxID=41803 RepID=A0A9P0Z4R2_CUSEU|nr:unnamed protein product [Cuscuta europaea]
MEKLREMLALSVTSIEWSYAIFWTVSSSRPGVLEWGDGYYNGDIKTRKTVQSGETVTDRLGLQRTECLRDLYESLLVGELNPQASAALSPDDLTDTEWLPGKAFEKNQTIWLCNAERADGKVFSRALLAKSASIQTVVCFPHLGGVIEFGVTELVIEDINLINRIKTSYLSIPHLGRNDKDIICGNANQDSSDATPKQMNILSGNNSSNSMKADQLSRDEVMVGGLGAVNASQQLPSWQIVEEEDNKHGNHNNSTNSSGSISQNYENCEKVSSISNDEKAIKYSLQVHQEFNQEANLHPLDNEVHYRTVLSSILKSSHQFPLGPYFNDTYRESSFVSWNKEVSSQKSMSGTSQRFLKKALCRLDGKNGFFGPAANEEADRSRVLSERRRREKINERFVILASLVPNSGKVDKVSILDETIKYVKDLKRRVCGAQSEKGLEVNEGMMRGDSAERTSSNCGTNTIDNAMKLLRNNKRKACEMEVKKSPVCEIAVSVIGEEVTVEIRCEWSEGVLIRIIESLTNQQLDCVTVRSSRGDGILSMTIKCKVKALKVVSPVWIKKLLKRVL